MLTQLLFPLLIPLIAQAPAPADPHASNAVIITSIITGGATLITAIMRWKPKVHQNGKGEILAKQVDMVTVLARLASIDRGLESLSEYTHENVHELADHVHALQLKEAARKGREESRRKKSRDDDEDSSVEE